MAMTKVKNLQLWCKKMAEGYRDVEVRDMAASWKSGLAFCAIIHRFRPDLIDYDSLSKENVFENNNLAFEVAEKQLNIPAFLEAADMVAIRVPDRLSVVTYVSQYYNYFHNEPQLGGPGVNKFDKSSKPKDNVIKPVNKSLTPAKSHHGNAQIKSDRQESIGDKCTICQDKVYLLERHIENSKLYHRSCFRKSELSPTSKVFKRQPHGPLSDEKSDVHSTKQRKIDTEGKKPETKDSSMDFWQRRAQQKSKLEDKTKTADTSGLKTENKFEPKKHESKVSEDVPIWKRGVKKEDQIHSDIEKDKPKFRSGLADKFKELDQRNLKQHHRSDDIHVTNKTHEKVKDKDHDKKVTEKSSDKKPFGDIKLSPVPKPRKNVLENGEKMEFETTESHGPKPVPRHLKQSEPHVPKAAPRHVEHGSTSPTISKKTSPVAKRHDFLRPKTPPHKNKAEFTLNITKPSPKSKHDESPSSPPPLPGSSPPRLPKSHPPEVPSPRQPSPSRVISPVASPRAADKHFGDKSKDKVKDARRDLAPAKPPRAVSEIGTRSPSPVHKDLTSKTKKDHRSDSPMDIGEPHVAAKATIKGPQTEHTAKLVIPNRQQDEKKSREVFGGLLKSLADVRQKHDHVTDDKAKHNGAISDKESKNKSNLNGAKDRDGLISSPRLDKSKEANKMDLSKNKQGPQRPKSSFVSQSSSLFDAEAKKEPDVKVHYTKKTTTTTVVTTTKNDKPKTEEKKTESVVTKIEDDIPEWKKQLDQRKKDKARPKSADILSERDKTENVPLWKIEADKRKDARKGGYVDPEKVKVGRNNNAAQDRPLSPRGKVTGDSSDRYVPPSAAEKIELPQRHKIEYKGEHVNDMKKTVDGAKKKITVDHTFNFEDIELKPAPKKPVRPAVTPASPKSPTSPKPGPGRPPPPKSGGFKSGKHHISAYQIQKQLQLIDTKLTQLELKGRSLEDSIRNAKDEEEDDMMISWFQLVNEKNDLVRKECDYIYISREQELEMEQQQIDHRLRDLVDKPNKSDSDITEEEYLMEKLVAVVYQRNKIVDSIDEDRLRYLEEDSIIEAMLQQKGFLKDSKDGAIKKDKKTKR